MKKLFRLIVFFIIAFSTLSSCNRENSYSLCYKNSFIETSFLKVDYGNSEYENIVITTKDELVNYFNLNKTKEVEDILNKYQNDFFNKNNLAIVVLNSTTSMVKYYLKRIKVSKNNIYLYIFEDISDKVTCDMDTRLMIVEIKKTSANKIIVVNEN